MIFFNDWSYPDEDCPSWILRERREGDRERFYRRCVSCYSCVDADEVEMGIHLCCDYGDQDMTPIWEIDRCPMGSLG